MDWSRWLRGLARHSDEDREMTMNRLLDNQELDKYVNEPFDERYSDG